MTPEENDVKDEKMVSCTCQTGVDCRQLAMRQSAMRMELKPKRIRRRKRVQQQRGLVDDSTDGELGSARGYRPNRYSLSMLLTYIFSTEGFTKIAALEKEAKASRDGQNEPTPHEPTPSTSAQAQARQTQDPKPTERTDMSEMSYCADISNSDSDEQEDNQNAHGKIKKLRKKKSISKRPVFIQRGIRN